MGLLVVQLTYWVNPLRAKRGISGRMMASYSWVGVFAYWRHRKLPVRLPFQGNGLCYGILSAFVVPCSRHRQSRSNRMIRSCSFGVM